MKRFWTRRQGIEARLRAERPEPRPEFLQAVAERVRTERRGYRRGLRLALAGALVAAMLVSLAGFGGVTYAASGVKSAAKAAQHVILAKKAKKKKQSVRSAARNQYAGEKCLVFHRTGSGRTQQILVNPHAVPAHQRHGDQVVCPAP